MSIATTPEPPPRGGHGPSIHDLVIADVEQRKALGLEKYGTILQVGDGRRSLVDAYQEALDLAVYLRQELAKRDGWVARACMTVIGWRWSIAKGLESYEGSRAFAGESGEGWAKAEAAHALARATEGTDG